MDNKKIIVLYAIDSLNLGGKECLTVQYANKIKKLGIKSYILVTRCGGPLEDLLESSDYFVVERNNKFDIKALIQIRNYIISKEINIVHSQSFRTSYLINIIRIIFQLKFVHICHNHAPSFNNVKNILIPYKYTAPILLDAYIDVYKENVNKFLSSVLFKKENAYWVNNGIDLSNFNSPLYLSKKEKFKVKFIYVGNIHPRKNHIGLIEAMLKIRSIDKIHLTFISSSKQIYREYFNDMIEKLNDKIYKLSYSVVWDCININSILNKHDVGIITSLNESGPLVLAEYMAAGLPFIATDTGDITKLAKEANGGYIIKPNDEKSLIKAIEMMASSKGEERKKMGMANKEFAIKHFNIIDRCVELKKIYSKYLKD